MQTFQVIFFNSFGQWHPKTFACLQQCPNEPCEKYLNHASELLLKIHYAADMSQISVDCLNHYTAVYGLNCRKLKDSIAGHLSVYWRSMEDCFRDICIFAAGYKKPKVIAELNLMPQKHQQPMKSSPQKTQDCALDVVDPISKTDAQTQKWT